MNHNQNQTHEKEKEKKKSIFSLKKKKEKEKDKPVLLGGGNPSISSPVFVKHVSGATQADEAERLIVGNRPPANIPVDVERKSKAMAIPIGVEQKPLVVSCCFFKSIFFGFFFSH